MLITLLSLCLCLYHHDAVLSLVFQYALSLYTLSIHLYSYKISLYGKFIYNDFTFSSVLMQPYKIQGLSRHCDQQGVCSTLLKAGRREENKVTASFGKEGEN